MFIGGHVHHTDDIVFLRKHGFDFGEVVLKDEEARSYWQDVNLDSLIGPDFWLIAHGPHEGDPNSSSNLLNNYYPALIETIDTISGIGSNFLTVHLWMDSRYVNGSQIQLKRRVLKDLFIYARGKEVTVSLENLSESCSDLEFALSEIPEASITLDIGHGQLLSKSNTSFQIIKRLAGLIHHVHLHDNSGGTGVKDDLHLPIGDGIIDFEAILKSLLSSGYNNTMTLELKRHELELSKQRIETIIQRVRSDLVS